MSRGGTPSGPTEVGCTDVIGSNPFIFFTAGFSRFSVKGGLVVEVADNGVELTLATDTGVGVGVADGVEGIDTSFPVSSMHSNLWNTSQSLA
jgi:hypothetical protein